MFIRYAVAVYRSAMNQEYIYGGRAKPGRADRGGARSGGVHAVVHIYLNAHADRRTSLRNVVILFLVMLLLLWSCVPDLLLLLCCR